MCRLSFFALTIGQVASLMESRLANFQSIVSLGFNSTPKADRYAVLSYRIYLIDNNLPSEYSQENQYWVDVPFDLNRAINVLRIKLDELKNDLKVNSIPITTSTSSYIETLRNRRIRNDLQDEMIALLDEAKQNLSSTPQTPDDFTINIAALKEYTGTENVTVADLVRNDYSTPPPSSYPPTSTHTPSVSPTHSSTASSSEVAENLV